MASAGVGPAAIGPKERGAPSPLGIEVRLPMRRQARFVVVPFAIDQTFRDPFVVVRVVFGDPHDRGRMRL
jgi:hypothetical protein